MGLSPSDCSSANLYENRQFSPKIGNSIKKYCSYGRFYVRYALKQKQIYHAWIGFKELQFDIPKLIQLAQRFQTKFSFFVGRYDQLLPPQQILPLSKYVQKQQTVLLDTGHTKLVDKVVTYLSKEGFS
jgi:hypothetical protein